MKLFAVLSVIALAAPIGDMDFSNMNSDGFDTMLLTFKPLFKQLYNSMDHVQSMKDFEKDDNGMFKRYFSFCDEGNTGLLTKDTHAACKIRIRDQMTEKVKFAVDKFGLDIPDVDQAKAMMEKLDAMNKEMFDQYVDGDNDGSATLEEIEMGGYCMFRVTAQMMIKMMDKNEDGKLDGTELNGMNDFNFEEYGFDSQKANELVKQADMDKDGAYDDRELAKVMFDMTDMMIQKIFN